ncbi:MAG: hypothetical protein ACHQ2Z_16325 [Elusimicrobiota bacterium]
MTGIGGAGGGIPLAYYPPEAAGQMNHAAVVVSALTLTLLLVCMFIVRRSRKPL